MNPKKCIIIIIVVVIINIIIIIIIIVINILAALWLIFSFSVCYIKNKWSC